MFLLPSGCCPDEGHSNAYSKVPGMEPRSLAGEVLAEPPEWFPTVVSAMGAHYNNHLGEAQGGGGGGVVALYKVSVPGPNPENLNASG